ncbi:MAG: lipoprotein-releasing ABC transporter permease subunit [Pseudomonadota bacterium]
MDGCALIRAMPTALELSLAMRYLRARQASRFASFMSVASMIGIAIGVCALITILSVMNGFESELRSRLLDLQAEGSVASANGPLQDWQAVRDRVLDVPGVVAVSPGAGAEGMANVDGRLVPILIEGIGPELESQVSAVAGSLIRGSLSELQAGQNGIVLGRYLALELGVNVGDSVVVLIPQSNSGRVTPELSKVRVVGMFDAGVPDYDSGVGWMHWQDVTALLNQAVRPQQLRLKLTDPFAAPDVSRAIAEQLGNQYVTNDWTVENASYFRAIRLEKAMMALILALVIGVAAFNIIASLVMVVSDKSTDIAILRTLGLAPQRVVRVFFTQGLILGWFGVLLGMVTGVLLATHVTDVVAFVEQLMGFQIMPGDVYVMTEIPSELRRSQVVWIAVLALGLTALATIYPARKAAGVHPAEALRYG